MLGKGREGRENGEWKVENGEWERLPQIKRINTQISQCNP